MRGCLPGCGSCAADSRPAPSPAYARRARTPTRGRSSTPPGTWPLTHTVRRRPLEHTAPRPAAHLAALLALRARDGGPLVAARRRAAGLLGRQVDRDRHVVHDEHVDAHARAIVQAQLRARALRWVSRAGARARLCATAHARVAVWSCSRSGGGACACGARVARLPDTLSWLEAPELPSAVRRWQTL